MSMTTATNEQQQVQTFATGAKRGTDHADCDLALIPPEAIRAWGRAFAEGRKKYGTHNWLKGFPQLGVINHALQHIYSYLEGDRSEDHLGHAMWNIGTAIHQEKHRPDLMDLPPYENTRTDTVTNVTEAELENYCVKTAEELVKSGFPNAISIKEINGPWYIDADKTMNAKCVISDRCNTEREAWNSCLDRILDIASVGMKMEINNVDLPCNPVQPPRQANPPSTIRASQPDRRTTDAIRVDDILADQSHASDCDGGGFAARV